ncbi:ATP-binding protein [Sporolituus thermophilus]|uniref:histidine kinase n=1 Tax=Sporolituus thermophilus DSM 23256 TaxID=1123285 RepID=A0A1G7IVJ9_9FIRM|nr:ATP-binding protein [Sporolituus thermophilus]SDF16697.1 two-component system, OmpR family, phosphate regulon sensor histidine kinase PhoR [Sporolituus thermophilus DSM 23256]
MFRFSLRNRLIFSFLLLIILTLATLGSYILWFVHKYNLERLTGNLFTQAQITEQLLRVHISGPPAEADLDAIAKELGAEVDLRLTIIDPNGVVLADSRENPALMENHLHRPEIAAALAGGRGTAIRHSTTLDENLLYVAIPMRSGNEIIGVVRLSTTLSHVETAYNRIRSALLAAFVVTTLLAIAFSIRLARKYTAPLEEITDVARLIGEGQLDKRVHIKTGDEIEILGHTLNNLAARLDDKLKEIVAQKHKLELILQHMDNAVLLLDRYGRVTDFNLRAASLFSITGAMLGQHNIQVIGNSLLDKAVRETVATGENRLIQLRTNLHGAKRVFQVFLAPLGDEGGGVLTVFHDITALQEIHERQAEFVANASHELKTPLTAIKGFAETLLDGAIREPALAAKFVTIIHGEAERMNRLIADLLQLASLDARTTGQQTRLEPTDIYKVAATVVEELSAQWRAKKLSVLLDAPAQPLAVMANPDWLKQVFVNLLDNSIKYTPDGGKVLLKWWQNSDKAVFMVQDSGIGIPAKDLPFIFDRFYRVDRARSRSAGGTGLGLAIVKHIIETLGGKIDVTSEPGAGTTFTFTLPLAKAQ